MKQKNIPMRTCVVTREKCEKRDLMRIVRNKEGVVFVDKTAAMKENGKGCYLKRDLNVINIAKQNKILDRVLEVNVSDEIYDELKKIVCGNDFDEEENIAIKEFNVELNDNCIDVCSEAITKKLK